MVIELYWDPADYSMRFSPTANASCMGRVIAGGSPLSQRVNWQWLYWHELVHVFDNELSGRRSARWYGEGLADYVSMVAKPDWMRRLDGDVHKSVANGAFPALEELGAHFVTSSAHRKVLAYRISSLAIEFLVERQGFPKVVEGLKKFRKPGATTTSVLPAITGQPMRKANAEFHKYLAKRLESYGRGYVPPFEWMLGPHSAQQALQAEGAARGALAIALARHRDSDRAANLARAVLERSPQDRDALLVLAWAELSRGKPKEARNALGRALDPGADGYIARQLLAELELVSGNHAAAQQHLERAMRFDPQQADAHYVRAVLLEARKQPAQALEAWKRHSAMRPYDAAAAHRVGLRLVEAGRTEDARAWFDRATQARVDDPVLFLARGDAYASAGQLQEALRAYDLALPAALVRPPPRPTHATLTGTPLGWNPSQAPVKRRPALVYIARARIFLRQNKTTAARDEVTLALRYEPKNPEALALNRQLGP